MTQIGSPYFYFCVVKRSVLVGRAKDGLRENYFWSTFVDAIPMLHASTYYCDRPRAHKHPPFGISKQKAVMEKGRKNTAPPRSPYLWKTQGEGKCGCDLRTTMGSGTR